MRVNAKAHLGTIQALIGRSPYFSMILTTDQRDFNTYRWKNTRPFRNLLEH